MNVSINFLDLVIGNESNCNSEAIYLHIFLLQLYFKSSKASEWPEDDKEERYCC